jgi:hypothetical protein
VVGSAAAAATSSEVALASSRDSKHRGYSLFIFAVLYLTVFQAIPHSVHKRANPKPKGTWKKGDSAENFVDKGGNAMNDLQF